MRARAKFSKNGEHLPEPALEPLPLVQKKAASQENCISGKSFHEVRNRARNGKKRAKNGKKRAKNGIRIGIY